MDQMEFLERLRHNQEKLESDNEYDRVAKRLRLHNHADAAVMVERLKYRDKLVPKYRVNMFGPVEPPLSSTKFKLPRFFGKP